MNADDDHERTYTPEEQARLTRQSAGVLRSVHAGAYNAHPMSLELLVELHRAMFHGVRDFAGQSRDRGRGQEYLTFGPNRSVHRNRVVDDVALACRVANVDRREAMALESASERAEASLRCALRFHAETIRIHPFEDGNGRTSRAVLNVLLVSMGLPPLVMEATKHEYIECLNRYHDAGDLDALVDLALRLLTDV